MSTPHRFDPAILRRPAVRSDAEFQLWEQAPDSGPRNAASATLVNRTHRIVRERAASLQAQRSRVRSLWIPLGVSAGLIPLISFAVWSVFDQNEPAPTGMPDASQQLFVFLMWCLPFTIVMMAVVWFKLSARGADEGTP